MQNPGDFNVVPGEYPEYFNGDDLKQRGMPLSSFVPGIFIWSSLESFLGMSAKPDSLEVNPVLPEEWKWAGAARIAYRGTPLSLLAVRDGQTLYSTAPVTTKWKTVQVPAELQDRYRFEPEDETLGLVLSASGNSLEVIAASSTATEVTVVERRTGHRFRISLYQRAGSCERNCPELRPDIPWLRALVSAAGASCRRESTLSLIRKGT